MWAKKRTSKIRVINEELRADEDGWGDAAPETRKVRLNLLKISLTFPAKSISTYQIDSGILTIQETDSYPSQAYSKPSNESSIVMEENAARYWFLTFTFLSSRK